MASALPQLRAGADLAPIAADQVDFVLIEWMAESAGNVVELPR
jgi:hypothetical protein